jgi:hypothetical protein
MNEFTIFCLSKRNRMSAAGAGAGAGAARTAIKPPSAKYVCGGPYSPTA